MRSLAIIFVVVSALPSLWGASYYTLKPDDPQAVHLTPASFPLKGDGIADDTETVCVWPGIRRPMCATFVHGAHATPATRVISG
jgi:hypothetical protein